jgi:hypothetical protein
LITLTQKTDDDGWYQNRPENLPLQMIDFRRAGMDSSHIQPQPIYFTQDAEVKVPREDIHVRTPSLPSFESWRTRDPHVSLKVRTDENFVRLSSFSR